MKCLCELQKMFMWKMSITIVFQLLAGWNTQREIQFRLRPLGLLLFMRSNSKNVSWNGSANFWTLNWDKLSRLLSLWDQKCFSILLFINLCKWMLVEMFLRRGFTFWNDIKMFLNFKSLFLALERFNVQITFQLDWQCSNARVRCVVRRKN